MFMATRSILYRKTLTQLLLLSAFIFLSPKTYAQLHIPTHNIISLQGDLISQERFNNINSSIRGTGFLILNGKQDQYLDTNPGIHIPNLTLNTKARVIIPNTIYIDGDFILDAHHITVLSPVYINGTINLTARVNLQGRDLIIENTRLTSQPAPWQRSQHSETFKITYSNTLNTQLQFNRLESPKLNHSFFHKSITVREVAMAIPTPPPEDSPLFPKGEMLVT